MFKESSEQSETLEAHTIALYGKVFYYEPGQHIQSLDSYQSDFVFINNFPKVMNAMSNFMDKTDFKEMLKSAIRTNHELCTDGALLDPEAKQLLKPQSYECLFKEFLGKKSDAHIIRANYFTGANPILDIKESLERNADLCKRVLSYVNPNYDQIGLENSPGKKLLTWLITYNSAMSYKK